MPLLVLEAILVKGHRPLPPYLLNQKRRSCYRARGQDRVPATMSGKKIQVHDILTVQVSVTADVAEASALTVKGVVLHSIPKEKNMIRTGNQMIIPWVTQGK